MIEPDSVVTVSYVLRTEPDGPAVETAVEDAPLKFVSGRKQIALPLFEANVLLKKAGEEFSFKITPESGYGEYDSDLVVELEKSVFDSLDGNELVVGNEIPMSDSMGRHLMGKVAEVGEDSVKMDFNHPLAGKTLYFSGKVLEVRPASEEELAALENHSCGGGCCSGCGGGCGHDHEHDHGHCCGGEGPSGCCGH